MKFDLRDVTKIPNLLVVFRFVCTPIFAGFLVYGGLKGNDILYYIGLAVFALASVSDLFDGMIARKYNMCTGLGSVADPLADKIMHITALYSLALIGYLHPALAILIAVKEIIMIVVTTLLKNMGIIVPANFYGKVPSALLSVGIILSFFHPYMYLIDHIIVIASTVLSYIAFVQYMFIWIKELKDFKQKNQNVAK